MARTAGTATGRSGSHLRSPLSARLSRCSAWPSTLLSGVTCSRRIRLMLRSVRAKCGNGAVLSPTDVDRVIAEAKGTWLQTPWSLSQTPDCVSGRRWPSDGLTSILQQQPPSSVAPAWMPQRPRRPQATALCRWSLMLLQRSCFSSKRKRRSIDNSGLGLPLPTPLSSRAEGHAVDPHAIQKGPKGDPGASGPSDGEGLSTPFGTHSPTTSQSRRTDAGCE